MFSGMFFARGDAPRVSEGLCSARLGRHELCSGDVYCDGGAMACACGRLRNRARLIKLMNDSGARFEPSGELSEIVLAAYRLWGEDYPSMIEGNVASAVVDVDASRLVLARDRMGETPIYYACRASSVVFSDEYARVLASPFVKREIGKTGIGELFALGPSGTPGLTPIDGVKAVRAGGVLVADCRGQRERLYFDLEGEPCTDGIDEAREKIRFLVEDSLDACLRYDPAVMLSGGLDSSILAFLAAKKGKKVRAWSVEYDENELFYRPNGFEHDPDGEYAKLACEEIGAERNIASISPDELAASLVEAGRARGFPGMGDIDASLMVFARAIARREKFALSGECADEVFGGYPWFHDERTLEMDGFPWSGSMDLRMSVLRRETLRNVNLRQYEAARYHEAVAAKKRPLGASERENRLRLTHGLCFEWFMPVLQLRARNMCQASGLEVMTPFCDDRLAKYVYSLRWEVKNAGGEPKGILRLAFDDLLPKSILTRRKSPYPKTHHPLYARAVCLTMEGILADKSQPINEICDADGVRAVMSQANARDARPWFGQLMTSAQLIAYLIQVNAFLRDNSIAISL